MKIKDILHIKGPQVWTVALDQTLKEAIRILIRRNIGALLVIERGHHRVAGIISERDIVRGIYEKSQPIDEILVSELMTSPVIVCSPEDEVGEIMSVMTEKRVRHIPVVAGGQLQGIVSIGDIVKSQLEDSEYQIQFLKEYMYGPTLDRLS